MVQFAKRESLLDRWTRFELRKGKLIGGAKVALRFHVPFRGIPASRARLWFELQHQQPTSSLIGAQVTPVAQEDEIALTEYP
jgi:hypothetical protein